MTTYRLLPILEELGACEPAQDWVLKHQYRTFKEAWEAAPSHLRWHQWLVSEMARRFPRGYALRRLASDHWLGLTSGDMHEHQRQFYIREHVRVEMEKMLIEYAIQNDCAVEVT